MLAALIEKRLNRAKQGKGRESLLNKGQGTPASICRLPSNHFADSEDESEGGSGCTEEPPNLSSETTCLLYDARQQQKEYKRYLLEQEQSEQPASAINDHEDPSTDRLASRADSPVRKSRKSSPDSPAQSPSMPPILDSLTRQGTLPARIQFNDSVRISGGIRSKRDKRRVSTSSIFTTEPPSTDRSEHKDIRQDIDGPDPSPPPQHVQVSTPRGSFSRGSGRISRAASFLSEDGTATGRSRASTPASIYAPLLLPSKTAPSPSRRFYLTFKRDDGQATYRELVRQQTERKRKKKISHRRGRQRTKASKKPYYGTDEQDDLYNDDDYDTGEDSDEEGQFGSGWYCGVSFWTCGIDRLFRRRRERLQEGNLRTHRHDIEGGNQTDVDDQHVSTTAATSSAPDTDSDSELDDNGIQESKSEMQVMFGSKPWRYLKLDYWMYRFRRSSIHEGDEELGF